MATDKELIGYYQLGLLDSLEFDIEETSKKMLREVENAKKFGDNERLIKFINEKLVFLQCAIDDYESLQKDKSIINIKDYFQSRGIDVLKDLL